MKNHILSQVGKNDLITLKFISIEAASELHWEHDKEFEYKGQMYDVVESKTHGDTTIYVCWWDHNETALNIQLYQLVEAGIGNDPQNHKNQEKLKDFFKSIYFSSLQIFSLPEPRNILMPTYFLYPRNSCGYYTLLSPPPETIS